MSDALLPVGSNRCRCSGCGRHFSGVSSFDKHQTTAKEGTTVCHDPADRGLVYDGRYWSWPPQEPGSKPWQKSVEPSEAGIVADAALARQGTLL